jgi:imidazole glycerol-phosphate synthase subunit HisH
MNSKMPQEILIIDYGMGNLHSVQRTLFRIGVRAVISSNPEDIKKAEKIILPGVGHFQKAVENLKSLNIWESLNESVLIKKTPILGICLGMQLMSKHSEEGDIDGLGWFDASVIKFGVSDKLKYKIPHIGWNQIILKKACFLFDDVDISTGFYFIHSYHIKCNNQSDVLNETFYEYPFVSAIQKDNIFGVQYHPEKSHYSGDKFLKNFSNL